jgi:hypothetical protein
MAIDMASVYAAKYRKTPDVLRAAVMGQSPDRSLDSYTALNALKLVKEADMMDMAGQAQQPTSSPSLVAQNMAPNPMQQGLGAMVPGTMGQAPQGMPPQQRAPMPQQPMQAASGGLAGMYTPEEDYAEGGIVAFQSGGLNSGEGMVAPAVSANSFDDYVASMAGDGAPSSTALSRAQEALERYMDFEPKEMSTKEQEAFLDRYMARVKRDAGEDIYAPAKEDLKTRREALAGDRKFGEGMAYLTAAGKVLEGRNLAEGASKAAPAFAQQLGESRRAEQQEKRAIEQMNFALNDAQRKERMGDSRGAQAALAEARKFQQDANRAHGDKLRFAADIAARTVGYSKVNKGAGSGDASTKLPQVDREAALITKQIIALEAKDPNDPQIAVLRKQREGLLEILGTGKEGPTAATRAAATITSKENTAAEQALTKHKLINRREWKKAVEAAGGDEKAAATQFKSNWITANPQSADEDGAPAPKPTSSAKPGTVLNYDASGKRIN